MARAVLLDSTPLALATWPSGEPQADECRSWLRGLEDAGIEIFIPEIVDYELRRELLRRDAKASLGRLDDLLDRFSFLPLDRAMMLRAAELWAFARQSGVPTADPHALDGDVILAAQALTAVGPDNSATIATGNVGHLARFGGVDAREWRTIG